MAGSNLLVVAPPPAIVRSPVMVWTMRRPRTRLFPLHPHLNHHVIVANKTMKKIVLTICVLVAVYNVRCAEKLPAGHPSIPGQQKDLTRLSGKVIETMNSGGYTYLRMDTGTQKVWAAAPLLHVKVGDAIVIADGMLMPKYHSKTLNRDFDQIYFTGDLT